MKRAILAFLCACLVATATARAGTTGVVTGSVTNENGAPVAAVKVVICSPVDRVATQTDAAGRFEFLMLPPDTYTISLDKLGYEPVSYAGVPVFADNSLALNFRLPKQLVTITDRGSLRPPTPFVKPGVGGDVWNIYDFNNRSYSMYFYLTTIPGLTFGTGAPIPH